MLIIAGLGLAGWILDVTFLKSVAPGLPEMKANTAIGLGLLGMSLILHPRARSPRSKLVVTGLSVAAAAIGAATLAEYAFDSDLGIDQLLFEDTSASLGPPGRPSIAASLSLMLLGTSLKLKAGKEMRRVADLLAAVAMFLAFVALLGYLFSTSALDRFVAGGGASISIHTAFAIGIAARGTLLIDAQKGILGILLAESPGAHAARRLLPVSILVPVATGWLLLTGLKAELFGAELAIALFSTSIVAVFVVFVFLNSWSLHAADLARFVVMDTLKESEAKATAAANRLLLMSEVAREFAVRTGDPRDLLDLVSERLSGLIGELCVIRLISDDGEWLDQGSVHHPDPQAAAVSRKTLIEHPQRVGEGISGRVVSTGEPVLIPVIDPDALAASTEPKYRPLVEQMQWGSVMVTPLSVLGQVIGVATMMRSTSAPAYTDDDMHLLQDLCAHAALAIANSRLLESMQNELNERIRVEEALRRSNEQRKQLLTSLVRAQEEERRRIASDVHDDSIQAMAAVSIRLSMLKGKITEPEQQTSLVKLEETVQDAIKRLRRLLFQLRPPSLDRDGLIAALREYLSAAGWTDEGVQYRVEDGITEEPSSEVRAIAFRIAQEALTNVRKHAKATEVTVEATSEQSGVRIRIRDNGAGFTVKDRADSAIGHIGLVSMRERAEIAGGWWRIESGKGLGTTVDCWIPDAAIAEGPLQPAV